MSVRCNIIPVILAGGQGARLWPTSTPEMPKQFIPLKTGGTTFGNTLDRIKNAVVFDHPVIICSEQNFDIVLKSGPEKMAQIICEPSGRNTTPACCIGTLVAQEMNSQSALVLILPADHYIPDITLFENSIRNAVSEAKAGKIVTFGIRPEFGHTEYGYIEQGYSIRENIFHVIKFTEKPDAKTAESFFKKKKHLWNSGIFLVRADILLSEFERYQSDILLFSQESLKHALPTNNCRLLPKAIFDQSPKISFDRAIMEHTDKACVMAVDFMWRDMGGWDALMEFARIHA